MRYAIAAAALMLASCAPSTAPKTTSTGIMINPAPVGVTGIPQRNETFSGTMLFLGRTILLPEGSWTVLNADAVGSRAGLVAAFVSLVRHDGPLLHGLLDIGANVRPSSSGFALNPICTSSDVLWNDVRAAVPYGRQDCAGISFLRPALWRENAKSLNYQQIQALDALGVQTPNIMVALSVNETNAGWFMSETLYLNPDAEGITPDLSTQRAQSTWAAFNLPKDPQKQQFVDRLKAKADPIRANLRHLLDTPPPYVPASGLTPA